MSGPRSGPDSGRGARLLRRLVPPAHRDEVLGDLEERYRSRRRSEGSGAARRWYRRQVVGLALWAVRRRVASAAAGMARTGGPGRGLANDVRVAVRGLARSPGWTGAAVLTLALAVGGNTAVFSVVDGVLLRPLPYPDAHELVAVHETREGRSWWSAALPNAVAWRARSRTLADVAWAQTSPVSLLPPAGPPEHLRAAAVSPNFLDVLRVRPALGRAFREGEDRPGAEPVLLLTHDAWTERYGGDPSAVGRRLELDAVSYTVVGVLPAGREPSFLGPHDVLVPRVVTEADRRNRARVFRTVGRLAPDVDLAAARAEMDALGDALDAESPAGEARGWGVRLVPLKEEMVGSARAPLLAMLAAVGLVMLVACANLGSLTLARGSARAGELAVRASLGAGRGRLVRLLLVESASVALAGGAVGLALATWGTEAILAVDPSAVPRLREVAPDGRLLLFTLVGSAGAVLLFGLLPAVQLARVDLSAGLRTARAEAGPAGSRLRAGLVAGQVALVVALLVGAGLLVRSVQALGVVDPGFETEGRLAVRLELPATRYPDPGSRARFTRTLTERVRAIPGVRAAGTVTTLPLAGGPGFTAFHVVRGLPVPAPGSEPIGGVEVVGPGYFEAMGIPFLAGRDFGAADLDGGGGAGVIVDGAMAVRFWAGADPLADAVRIAPPGAGQAARWRDVVGVVGAVRYGLDTAPRPRLYLPEGQLDVGAGRRTLVVRTTRPADAPPEALVRALRDAVGEVDPLLPVVDIERLEAVSRASISRYRFQAAVLGVFAAVALGLGAVGVYGAVSYSVVRRAREVGVRLALGASRPSVVARVLRRALAPVLVGLAVGVPAAGLLSLGLHSSTFGVAAFDRVSFVLAPGLLLAVAGAAALVPGLRTSRIDPVRTLREE